MEGHWLICIKSYEIDGKEFSRGTMVFSYARFPTSGLWERATKEQIETKKLTNKGVYYNHNQ